MVGFVHKAVLGVADKVIEAVKTKDIRHFFLVAGCEGQNPKEMTTPGLWNRYPKTVWFSPWRAAGSVF